MGRDFADTVPESGAVFSMGEALRTGITQICFGTGSQMDGALLGQTANTQPCLFLTDLAIAEAFRAVGLLPGGGRRLFAGRNSGGGVCRRAVL